MAINYFSPVRLTLALLPGLIERSGRIVNISSVAARLEPAERGGVRRVEGRAHGVVRVRCRSTSHDTGVRVHVVNPGIIDTDLFHLPDNDAPIADEVEALPVEAIVAAGARPARRRARSRSTSPSWFADVVAGKFPDTGAFLDGTIEWLKTKSAKSRFGVD